jgi:hypothetical protein
MKNSEIAARSDLDSDSALQKSLEAQGIGQRVMVNWLGKLLDVSKLFRTGTSTWRSSGQKVAPRSPRNWFNVAETPMMVVPNP